MAAQRAAPAATPNKLLAGLLDQLGWRPETLARRVNAALSRSGSSRQIHDKTPYRWLRSGELPHGAVPDLVVQVIAGALGTELDFAQVWQADRRRQPPLRADQHNDLPWDDNGLISLLGEPVPTRRTVIAVTGAALTQPVWHALGKSTTLLRSAADEAGTVTPPLLAMIDSIVAAAQHLDEQQGAAARDYVADQFTAVGRLLRRASYDAQAGRRLGAALAQLAQTSGFMAFDSVDDGRAQWWYLGGLRAAHLSEPALAASILALLSNQAADRGYPLDALQLASAAQLAAGDTPAAVKSLVAARSSLAYASAGDLSGFSRLREQTLALMDTRDDRPLPGWAGYIDRVELDAITGRGLVVLASHLPLQRGRLLRQAQDLLHARAHTDPSATPQRSALRHGAWLSLAYLAEDDLDRADTAARLAMSRLPAVNSQRSIDLLHRVQQQLAPMAHRSPKAKALVRDLHRKLRS